MLMRDGIAVLMRILIKRVPVYKLGFHSNLDYFAVFTEHGTYVVGRNTIGRSTTVTQRKTFGDLNTRGGPGKRGRPPKYLL